MTVPTKSRAMIAAAACVVGSFSVAVAQEDSLAGDWMLELNVPPADVYALLELEQTDAGWAGYVEGGPVAVRVDGRELEITIDSRDIAGFVFERQLVGELDGDQLSGSLTIVDDPESIENGARWTGQRVVDEPETDAQPPQPFDLSGTWVPAPGADIRKYSMDLTPAAKAWHDGYQLHIDQPNVRCVSPGIVAMIAWASYPSEWLVDDDRITIIYEVGSEVRRVYLDGREPPEFYPPSPMGFSTGHWQGATFVIETRLLARNVRDFLGEPISENAQFVERYTLGDDGTQLSAVMTLHDPENYLRPVIRRRQWRRDPDAVVFPYECDPDSFYRQLYEEGKMQDYLDRADRRL